MNIPDNQQWLSDGECEKCRRHNYCQKSCKAHQRKVERAIKAAISGATYNVISKYIYKPYNT